jgi:hypothetical protein
MSKHFFVFRIILACGALFGALASWFDIYSGFFGSLFSNGSMAAIVFAIYDFDQMIARFQGKNQVGFKYNHLRNYIPPAATFTVLFLLQLFTAMPFICFVY